LLSYQSSSEADGGRVFNRADWSIILKKVDFSIKEAKILSRSGSSDSNRNGGNQV
jgi:hypothetical protein